MREMTDRPLVRTRPAERAPARWRWGRTVGTAPATDRGFSTRQWVSTPSWAGSARTRLSVPAHRQVNSRSPNEQAPHIDDSGQRSAPASPHEDRLAAVLSLSALAGSSYAAPPAEAVPTLRLPPGLVADLTGPAVRLPVK